MKGLLNNPKIVIALAIGAFVFAGNNILSPLLSDQSSTSDDFVPPVGIELNEGQSETQIAASAQPSVVMKQSTERVINGKTSSSANTREFPQIGWATVPKRDPFRFADVKAGNLDVEKATPPLIELPAKTELQALNAEKPENVRAVVIGPTFKLAIVDGELLGQGDTLLDGRINVLNSDSVEFQDKVGARQTLSIEQLSLGPDTP